MPARRGKSKRKGGERGEAQRGKSREMEDARVESQDTTALEAAAAAAQSAGIVSADASGASQKLPSILSHRREKKRHQRHRRHTRSGVQSDREAPAPQDKAMVSAIADALNKMQTSLTAPGDAEVPQNAPAEPQETAPTAWPRTATIEPRRASSSSFTMDRPPQFAMQAYNPAAGMWMEALSQRAQMFGPQAQFQPAYPHLPYALPSMPQPFQQYAPGLIPTGLQYPSPALSMTGFAQNPTTSAQAPFVPAPYNVPQPYSNVPAAILVPAAAQEAAPTRAATSAFTLALPPTVEPQPTPAAAPQGNVEAMVKAAVEAMESQPPQPTTRKGSIASTDPAVTTALPPVGDATGTVPVPHAPRASSFILGSEHTEAVRAAPEDSAAAADRAMTPKHATAKGRKHRRKRRETIASDVSSWHRDETENYPTSETQFHENIADSQIVTPILATPQDDDIASTPVAAAKSSKRASRSRSGRHRSSTPAGKPTQKSSRTPEEITAAASVLVGRESVAETALPPLQNNVVLDTEMAKRLLAALEKCEQKPSASPAAGASEHTCDLKYQSAQETKPGDSKRSAKSTEAKEHGGDLGSSEEFFEEINEEIVEPENDAKDGQRKRVVRRTTKSRRHNVNEQPWDDGGGPDEIPPLLQWEDIQPQASTRKGTGKTQRQGSSRRTRERGPQLLAERPPGRVMPPHFEFGLPSDGGKGRVVAAFGAGPAPPGLRGRQQYPPRGFPFPRYPTPSLCCGTKPLALAPYDPRMGLRPYEPAGWLRGFNHAGTLDRRPRPLLSHGVQQPRGPVMPYPGTVNSVVGPPYARRPPLGAYVSPNGRTYPAALRGLVPNLGQLRQTAQTNRPHNGAKAHQARLQGLAAASSVAARTPSQRSLTFATRLPSQDCHYQQAVGLPITAWPNDRSDFPQGASTSRHGVTMLPRNQGRAIMAPRLSAPGREGLLPSTSAGLPCMCQCHADATHSVAQPGVSLEELLRREDEIRRDEQLRQRRWFLDDQMILHDEQCRSLGERLDEQRRLLDSDAAAPPCLNCSTVHL